MLTVRRAVLFLVTIAIIVVSAVAFKMQQTAVYKTYLSPDKRFKLVLYSYWRMMAMPGSGSDARGLLCLYDETTQKELKRCKVDIVLAVDQVEWSATNVYVPLIADWPLPPPK